MVTKRGLKIIVTSLKGKSRVKVKLDGQKAQNWTEKGDSGRSQLIECGRSFNKYIFI